MDHNKPTLPLQHVYFYTSFMTNATYTLEALGFFLINPYRIKNVYDKWLWFFDSAMKFSFPPCLFHLQWADQNELTCSLR